MEAAGRQVGKLRVPDGQIWLSNVCHLSLLAVNSNAVTHTWIWKLTRNSLAFLLPVAGVGRWKGRWVGGGEAVRCRGGGEGGKGGR